MIFLFWEKKIQIIFSFGAGIIFIIGLSKSKMHIRWGRAGQQKTMEENDFQQNRNFQAFDKLGSGKRNIIIDSGNGVFDR